ncbi:hypothetical protein MMC21_005918 [Puttea exsequens]|nr:hypothetical protein [Puttea exsequens]
MYHYSVPPQGWTAYNYNTSASTSPSNSPPPATFKYYIPPQYASPTTTPKTKRHSKKTSYGSPQPPGGWHSPAAYPSAVYYKQQPDFVSPPVYQDVSNFDRVQPRARRSSSSAKRGGGGNYEGSRRYASVQSQKQRVVYVDTSDEAEDSPTFGQYRPRAQPTSFKQAKYTKSRADGDFFFNQEPVEKGYDSQKTRPRRSSQSRPTTASKSTKPAPQPREATAADAAKYRIPAGYSLKNWDPTESPVLLLGSVFDANSLGKWIYDWTVFRNGPDTPLSEVAGDLWLLLIKLSHKMKRADECLPRVRSPDNQELLEDFLESGDRLWARFKKLLKVCEEYMWKAAKKEGVKGSVKMGKNSGCEFVDSIFGRDRKLEETESLMQGVRLWNMRFDANCEDILRRPAAV